MKIPEKLKALVAQMPDPDKRSMFTTDIDKEKIEKALAEMFRGGRETVLALIDMLGEPGKDEDVKPHYASHCLENYALIVKDEKARREFSETLAGELDSDRPKPVKAFLCQQLQWSGGEEAAPGLGKLLLDDELVESAAMALVAIHEGAAEPFRAALPKAKGKCRLNIVQGLGAIGDTASASAIRDTLGDSDRETRIAAGWALARMGDASSVDSLIRVAEVGPGWERVQATKHCLVLAEKLVAAGRCSEAEKIYKTLHETRTDPSEKYVREAAERGLKAAKEALARVERF